MLLIKQENKQSTKRLQIKYTFLHKHLTYYKQRTKWVRKNIRTNTGAWAPLHVKFDKKKEIKLINTTLNIRNIFFVTNYANFTTKAREFVIVKNMYNQSDLFPATGTSYPGLKLYPKHYLALIQNLKKLVGQFIPLIWIPINMPICFLFNKFNNKNSYIKSTGTKGVKKRFIRQEKLINVLLPSGETKVFPTNTLTLFTPTYNLEFNRVVEGGWGYFSKNKKNLTVRGVAKNPVDHPNGGRTKAKQPELSPWGWIAKHNK